MRARRPLLLPLTPLYWAVVRAKRWMYERGRLQRRRLAAPVISVGSVSAGGAGKTPVVLMLAEVLGRRGYAVRILTRGYGRGTSVVERVDAAGDAARFGDEPMLLARRTGVPVYVGADRYAAGLKAEEMTAKREMVFLLDDGFQHQRLERDVDVVLLTRRDVEDAMLPAGNLREPIAALKGADVLAVREDEAESLGAVIAGLGKGGSGPTVWTLRRRLVLPGGAAMPGRPVAFCGIARPESFWGMLEEAGCRPVGRVSFRDHHRYSERDCAGLAAKAWRLGADGFVTTEKDAVRLTGVMRAEFERVGPVVAAELRVELADEDAAVEAMIRLAPRMSQRVDR